MERTIKRLLLLLFFVGALFGASLEQKAAYQCSLGDKDSIYRGLNNFKTIYIKSIIDEDRNLRIKALKGIITCSKKLGIDHSDYTKELYDLLGKKAPTQASGTKSAAPSKKRVAKAGSDFKTKRAQSKKSAQPRKSLQVVGNRLTKVILRRGYIEFYFDFPITQVRQNAWFDKKSRSYKVVIEIPAKLATRYKKYRLRSVRTMQLVQSDAKHTRIIFTNPRSISISTKAQGNKLIVYLRKSTTAHLTKKSTKPKKVPAFIKKANKVIVIDAGHGGKDSGAVGYKRKKEKDIVLQIAKKVYAKLKKAGYKVYLTRRGDYFVTLRNRTRFANRVKANLFISIHANAAPTKSKYLMMRGLETFYLSPARSERAKRIAALENRVDMKNLSYYSKNVYLDFINREKTILSNKLAIDIQRNVLYALRKRFKVVDGGVRPGPFWVLVGAQMPSILIEVGYITNPTEATRLSNPYYQNLIAEGILSGVESYFRHNERY